VISGRTASTLEAAAESLHVAYGSIPSSLDEMRAELFALLASARERAGDAVPLTSIEREVAGFGDLTTFVTHVVASERLTPHLVQVTVRGGLEEFGSLGGDQFVYVLLPPEGRAELTVGTDFTWSAYDDIDKADRPNGAYYTVRRWRPAVGEIDLWFVLHGDDDHDGGVGGDTFRSAGGPASRWAALAKPGDPLALWGPRVAFGPPVGTTAYLLIGDETALGAIGAIIDQLIAIGDDVTIAVIAEVVDAEHTVAFVDHPAVTITWLLRGGRTAGTGTALLEAVRRSTRPALDELRTTYVFGAGESKQISAVRRYLRDDCELDASQVSMTGYWRRS
jgi:NADPH-dependent ferric siderophore reductase